MRRLAPLLVVALALAAAAADELHVLRLKHRPASELLPAIRPLLGPDDAVSGVDYRLIVRAPERTRREIERVVAQLDIAARDFTLTVRQVSVAEAERLRREASGEARLGRDARVTMPRRAGASDEGLVIGGGGRDGELRYQTAQRRGSGRDERTQTLRVQDGRRAFLRVGQSVPHVKKILALTGRQPVGVQGVEYQNVVTGFDVTPQRQGERVVLQITPRLSSLAGPATGLANFQELSTTVSVRPGEWIDLGRIQGTGEELRRTILESDDSGDGARYTVLLRVE